MGFQAILISGLFTVFNWLLRTVVLKFVLFGSFFLITTTTTQYLMSKSIFATGPSGINTLFGNFGSDVWYFLNVFNIPAGISMLVSAYGTRFAIRRIPGIG